MVEQGTENPRVVGSIPIGGTTYADLAHLVERDLAKVEVAGSSPVIRSIIFLGAGQVAQTVKSKLPLRVFMLFTFSFLLYQHMAKAIWHHSQAVRQRSAKPLFPSSILGGASKTKSTSQEVLFVLELSVTDENRPRGARRF